MIHHDAAIEGGNLEELVCCLVEAWNKIFNLDLDSLGQFSCSCMRLIKQLKQIGLVNENSFRFQLFAAA